MRRHDWPTSVLVLITVLAVSVARCTGSASPDTAAASSPSVTLVATATPMADSPTKCVALTPTAPDQGVEQGLDVTAPPAAPGLELEDEAERAVQLAKEDLAQRVGLALEQIALASVQEVQWLDASLGCPQPGEVYDQVITPGFRMVLQAGGRAYEYHSDQDQTVVLCQWEEWDVEPLMPVAPHGIPGKPRKPSG